MKMPFIVYLSCSEMYECIWHEFSTLMKLRSFVLLILHHMNLDSFSAFEIILRLGPSAVITLCIK
jgi:hypothetical protein